MSDVDVHVDVDAFWLMRPKRSRIHKRLQLRAVCLQASPHITDRSIMCGTLLPIPSVCTRSLVPSVHIHKKVNLSARALSFRNPSLELAEQPIPTETSLS
jgi:hypothetical protein